MIFACGVAAGVAAVLIWQALGEDDR